MADPLTRTSPLSAADEAVRLLRQAPLALFLCHWIGSVPLALGLLFFRDQMTRPRIPASAIANSALLLVFLLTWMNCWRAVFAGRLRRQLSGVPDPPWSPRRLYRLIAAQAWFGATKLYVLPLSALILFTAADTIAFYRIACVLSDRDDLDLWQLRARARQIATASRRENWTILPILFFLQLVAAINLALVLALLPQLFRILTGIETSFSRSGLIFVENPLFPLIVLALTGLVLDPYVQAVYCVRCFHTESIETGEDVRSSLRRIRAGAPRVAAALLLVIAIGVRAAEPEPAAFTPPELQQAIQQAMQSHEYDWRLPPDPALQSRGKSWIVDATDRALAGLQSAMRSLRQAIGNFFKWLLDRFRAAPEPAGGAPPATALHWSVYLLIGLVLAAALWIAWQKHRARRAKPAPAATPASAVPLDQEDLAPDRLPEEQWLELAARCAAEQNFRLALRACYLANLAWLGRTQFLSIHPGKTNREYDLELRRRAREFPEARRLFGDNIAAFERAWYGLHAVAPEDLDGFRDRMARIKTALSPASEVAA